MPRKSIQLNTLQLAVAAIYCEGAYANDKTEADVEEAGDTLYKYAIAEAADLGNNAEYKRRLQTAIEDLQALKDAIGD